MNGAIQLSTLEELLALMRIEEKARTCSNRTEAQQAIRRAEQARKHLWENTRRCISVPGDLDADLRG